MHPPGIEPGLKAVSFDMGYDTLPATWGIWEALVMPLDHECLKENYKVKLKKKAP